MAKENKWQEHIKEVRKDNKDMSFKEVLQEAKKSYKKQLVGEQLNSYHQNLYRIKRANI